MSHSRSWPPRRLVRTLTLSKTLLDLRLVLYRCSQIRSESRGPRFGLPVLLLTSSVHSIGIGDIEGPQVTVWYAMASARCPATEKNNENNEKRRVSKTTRNTEINLQKALTVYMTVLAIGETASEAYSRPSRSHKEGKT